MIHWYQLKKKDLHSVNKIALELHPGLPERPEVFEEKLNLFPLGCKKLICNNRIVGYGLSHPWSLNRIPHIDTFLCKLPEKPDCIHIHDIAVLPEARGLAATSIFISDISTLARQSCIATLSLVSVYMTREFWIRYGFKTIDNVNLSEYSAEYGSTATYMTFSL